MAMITFELTCAAIFSNSYQVLLPARPLPPPRLPPTQAMAIETIVGEAAPAEGQSQSGSKRRAVGAGASVEGGASGSSQGSEVKDILGRLPRTIGTGEHEKPILEGMAMALQDLVLEVQDLKGAVYRSWRLEPDCPYITQGMKFKELYNKKCREVRGKGQDLGHQRNWVFLGLLVALKEDQDVGAPDQQILETTLMKKVRNAEGHIDPSKAKVLAGATAYCQVVRLAKVGWINILVRGDEGEAVYKILTEALTREGDLSYEGPPPKPVHKEIKTALQAMYRAKDRR